MLRASLSAIEGLRGPAPRGYNGDDVTLVQWHSFRPPRMRRAWARRDWCTWDARRAAERTLRTVVRRR